MNDLQKELRAERVGFNIEILGINRTNYASFNATATAGRNLPWLQDRFDLAVAEKWKATYRDVRILDPVNRLSGVFNLTSQNLLLPTHYTALKKLLLEAAKVVDSDGDRLPDLWEEKHFGNLTPGPNEDADHDGVSNLAEWAHGTSPLNSSSRPSVRLTVVKNGALNSLVATFRRPAPAMSLASYELSPQLGDWQPGLKRPVLAAPDANLFDGTGCFETSFRFDAAAEPGTQGFFRITLAPVP